MLNRKGFTMVEVLIAVFVITIGVVGSYIILQQIFANTFVSSSRLTAAYLAKEGFEIVRNVRDSNWVAGNDWDTNLIKNSPPGFNGCDLSEAPPRFCEADHTDTALTSLSSSGDPNPLTLNGSYLYGAGADTKFSRTIEVKSLTADSARVIITISWEEQGNSHSITVEGLLYDWR